MKKIALFFAAVIVLFAACDGQSGAGDAVLTVKPSELTLKIGETARISVSATPAGSYEYEWKSADEKVATVANGVVTAVAIGNTTISVNIKGSEDVQTVPVSVVGELENVKYQGLYLMMDKDAPLYEVQDENGDKKPVTPMNLMFVPDNFYVSAGQWAGSWDFPLVVTTTVEDRRHLSGTGNEQDGYIMVFGYYAFAPASECVITDVNEAGDDIVSPHYIATDDFNKENYEKFLYEALITYAKQEVPDAVYEQYPYMTDLGAYLYKWSWDDEASFVCGYATGEGVMFSPGYPEGDNVFFADIAYDFNVKFFTNADYYGLDLVPTVDEETGEEYMVYPRDENDMPIVRMAEMTDHHFVGGTVAFPESSEVSCPGLTSAAVEKISGFNRIILKSVTYNRDLKKLLR